MSSSTTQLTANREKLYRQTNDILNIHSIHFIPISLLFFPFTFAASTTVQFYFSSSHVIFTSSQNLLTLKTLITVLTFCCFVILPMVAGVALITYNTNQIIHHKPITFSSTVKSLSHSYIRLLYTFVSGSITLILILLTVTETIKVLGLLIVSFALAITILFFIVIWGSAAAITVLESKSGFESLRQSMNQSYEFQRHSLSIVFVTGYGVGTALVFSTLQVSGRAANWIWILQVVVLYLQSSLMILQYVVANTVLYVQCMVASGEEIAKTAVEGEVSGEYVRLVMNDDDGEGLHEPAAKEEANGGFKYSLCLLPTVWVIVLFCNLIILFCMIYRD